MVRLLRQLISGLSDTVGTWGEFRRKEIEYFLCDGESPTVSSSLKSSVAAVNKAFSDLKVHLRKLRDLEKELCEDNPQGLNAYLSFGNHEAAIFQQRTASHVEVLTVITIVFFPLGLAATIFSTQGVLPFAPNLVRFTYVLFILSVLVVVTLVVLFNWGSWFQPIVERVMAELNFRKGIIYYNERLVGEEIRDASPRASKRRFDLGRPRKADLHKRWDLEKG
jgi:hypothetical protein